MKTCEVDDCNKKAFDTPIFDDCDGGYHWYCRKHGIEFIDGIKLKGADV